ncbi:hypothetical protein [Actinokineospora sp. NBRC 105648]|uniref:hypothetical protein n=1 Tax=Actinokineospora sp. NBRC 105648 TaxID=3032206 RepID=UPI0024A0DD4B|nr:hypothetical protein [Actinokineospora sp. NBRC 105648]GLZ36563.1 hypothetical protein Acsp05_01880 [Actinokineospora sp. NBRC 105648]
MTAVLPTTTPDAEITRDPVYGDLVQVSLYARVLFEAIADGELDADDLGAFEQACQDSLVRCRQLFDDPAAARAIALAGT